MGKPVNGKQSVASMWAEMVQAAVAGEVVGVVDKHGRDVAVMISLEMYEELVQRATRSEPS